MLYPGAGGVPAPTISEAVTIVEEGGADLAVVPIENNVFGPVLETLRRLQWTMLRVRASAVYRVRLVAAGDPGGGVVYSHSQALGEAGEWIRANLPGARLVPVSSTGEAALRAARDGGLCICSREAATRHGLPVVAEDVDGGGNYTRFLVLGWEDDPGGDRTMILAVLRDEPGSLYRFLEPLALAGVNLSMIYSMPVGGEWRYIFYLEATGSRLDPRVKEALAGARRRAVILNVLGSYRRIVLG
ncbi:MAG: ACT domain-containing protein [Desulfurococcales archaeon]|nr:ACT domain-containing protein [Desulfurococcales archaeon]